VRRSGDEVIDRSARRRLFTDASTEAMTAAVLCSHGRTGFDRTVGSVTGGQPKSNGVHKNDTSGLAAFTT
jgi:hypothetical protein